MDSLEAHSQRKSVRLKGYDYAQSGYYFITICTRNRELLFGKIDDGEMILSSNGIIANCEASRVASHYHGIEIHNYVIMPNHVHLMIAVARLAVVGAPLAAPVAQDMSAVSLTGDAGAASGAPTIGNIIRGYKSGVSRLAGFSLWQRNYYEHIVRNDKECNSINEYINMNPLLWEADCHNPNNKKK